MASEDSGARPFDSSAIARDDESHASRPQARAWSGLDRATAASVAPALRLLAPLYFVLALSHLFVLTGAIAWAMAGLAMSTAIAYAVTLLRLHRSPLTPAHGHSAAGGVAALVLINCVVHLVLVGEAADTTNILIFMSGAGFLLLSRAWLAASLALAWGGWIAAAAMHPGEPWPRYVFSLISASVLAIIVHAVRVRTVVRLEDLRLGLEERVQQRTRELETANRLLRTVIDHLPDAVTIRDLRGTRQLANEPAQRLGEVAATEVEAEVEEDRRVIATGEPVVERASTRGNHDFVVSKYPLRDSLGQVTGVVDVRRDVTETRRQEEARRQIEQRMQQAQRLQSLGVLTGGIAHDFNNLLTGVLGAVSLIRLDEAVLSRVEPYVQQIESGAMQAAELCRQMLAYAGQGRTVVERADLTRVIRSAIPLIRSSASRRIDLRVKPATVPLPFDGDPSQIRQVIVNLVINAAEAVADRPDGLVELTTGSLQIAPGGVSDAVLGTELAPGLYGVVQVTDNGSGIAPDTQQRIFEPFFTTKFAGRGLGLAVVLGIARQHGGTVKVYSEPGRGSTFRVLLPLAPGGDGPGADAPAAPLPSLASLWGTALVIDDEATVREVVAAMLVRLDMTPVLAEDGRRGLELYRASPDRFRVVIVDLTMPVASGRDVLRALRADTRHVPVLLVSGFTEGDIVLAETGAGPAAFLQKPFSIEDLRRSLSSLLAGPGAVC